MNDMSIRRWYRIHFSSLIVAALVALALAARLTSLLATDYQALANRTEWSSENALGDFQTSVKANSSAYVFEMEHRSNGWDSDFTVKDPLHAEIFHEVVHSGVNSPFIVKDDVLYFPRYATLRTGCKLEAYDLKQRKYVWQTWLYGIGKVGHTKYNNQVWIKKDGDVLFLFGKESKGSYLEIVDIKSGRSLANRIYDDKAIPSSSSSAIQWLIIAVASLCAGGAWEAFMRQRRNA
jgi:hypothetical protein